MSEELKEEENRLDIDEVNAERGTNEQPQEAENILDPFVQLKKFSRGKIQLLAPIRARGKDIEVLHFDFFALTGKEYCEAMDIERGNMSIMGISAAQALALFAAAAGKVTPDVDAKDVRERISAQDAAMVSQLAAIFFNASNRAAGRRISNE